MKKLASRIVLGGALALVATAATSYLYGGAYLLNTFARRGVAYWLPMGLEGPRLSPSMRFALTKNPPATAGAFEWRAIDEGFEVADLPVMADGHEVDEIHLARIDPARFQFVARNGPAGDKDADRWMSELGAVLVVNGSYYAATGDPDTPFVSDGKPLGPKDYDAKAGAFVASPGFIGIRNLADTDWKTALQGAQDAMVSYPLLVADGANKVLSPSQWLANRSFVGQDSIGRIIIGTTHDAFFSIARLADFLVVAPLDLKIALNLDGGPVATQAIDLKGYRRRVYGLWEAQVDGSTAKLLTWPWGTWALPIVLAVLPKPQNSKSTP